MSLVRGALRNPHAVAVLVLAILILGLTVLGRMPVDILPVFKTPAVQVLTLYPGMPAEVVEKDITTRLERWTGQSNGIARQESKSMIGVSVVRDFFRPDIDPDTALSMVTSLAMSDLYYLPPGTIPPMVMPFDPTAMVPLALLSVSSEQHGLPPAPGEGTSGPEGREVMGEYDETELYDIAYFDLRNRLQGIPGVIAPAVYGGKLRRILAYVDREKLQARRLSPMDVVQSLRDYNLMIPMGNAKFGAIDYQIDMNSMVPEVADLNEFPVKLENGAPVYLRDVGEARDAAQIQTNIVRVNGRRQVYIPIYRQPGANTIAVVEGVKDAIKGILERLPRGVRLDVVMDQSIFVRKAVRDLAFEAVLGGALAALVVLVFIGGGRATGIALVTLPLAALASFIGLSATGDSVNTMTLGGLALAVGLIIDEAIVVIENVARHLGMGKPPFQAALEGAGEVARPLLILTVVSAVVFLPVVFLTGIGRFLFGPLALAGTFARFGSYALAITIVPLLCARMLKARRGDATDHDPRWLARLRDAYGHSLGRALGRRRLVILAAAAGFAASLALIPRLGRELFPTIDAGQLAVKVRGATGTRVEETERLIARVERSILEAIPERERAIMISNIGLLYDWPAAYTPNSGPQDAFIAIQLTGERTRTAQAYAEALRTKLAHEFPGTEFALETGGMLTAALNFGLPSPLNVQVEGNDLHVAHEVAERVKAKVERVPGARDVRIQQRLDYPQIKVEVDRVKAAHLGLTQERIVKNAVTALNSSINFAPAFWIDERNGNHYFIGAQYEEAAIEDLSTLADIPLTSGEQRRPVLLKNIARFERASAPGEVNHLNLSRVIDLYANVEGRDLGSVAAEVERAIEEVRAEGGVPSGYRVHLRGEVASMKESFGNMGFGLALAAVLVYLVMVVQFRSFLDPLIVMAAIPLGLIGVVLALLLTGTAINIQSLMGVIMMIGIVCSFSILLIDFANRARAEGKGVEEALVLAGKTRLRPILMTSIAATLGLLPMAVVGGANIPLARAVIGGILASTVLTLFVVPAIYRMLRGREAHAPAA